MAWVAVAAGGTALAGAGMSYMAAKKAGQQGNVQRDPGKEMSSFFNDPKNWNGYLNFQNQATATGGNAMGGVAQQSLGLYPQINSTQIAGQNQTRGANLSDLAQFGGSYQQALQGMSPVWSNSLSQVNNMVGQAGQSDMMGQMLNQSTGSNLALGSGLSDQQIRDVTQGARAGLADRGMAMGKNAIGTELLSRDQYGQQLLAQRQAAASGVENQNLQRTTQGQNFALNAANLGQQSISPALSLFGQPSVNVGMSTQYVSPTAALQSANGMGSEMLGYMGGANNFNANAQIDAIRSQANLYGAMGGSLMGMGGQLGGDAIKYGSTQGTTAPKLNPFLGGQAPFGYQGG